MSWTDAVATDSKVNEEIFSVFISTCKLLARQN